MEEQQPRGKNINQEETIRSVFLPLTLGHKYPERRQLATRLSPSSASSIYRADEFWHTCKHLHEQVKWFIREKLLLCRFLLFLSSEPRPSAPAASTIVPTLTSSRSPLPERYSDTSGKAVTTECY